MADRPATIGALRESGWESRPVKEEVRANAMARMAAGEPVVSGLLGYDDTVLPQLENALLAGHDLILLGERGQAKTRIIRSLVDLLDEWSPIIAGSEINDDPYHPVSKPARDLVAERGDDTAVEWVHRSRRFGEKLATPDTSIADLIGEVDPIRVAEGRYLADELTIHYGLVPRTNRGVFGLNELPDLAERIQVGLLNIMEEMEIMEMERTPAPEDVEVLVPAFMKEVVAELTHLARRSPHISQSSGVSVRMSIGNYENLVSNSVRRAVRLGETVAVPRMADLRFMAASTSGRVEIEALDEGKEEQVLERIQRAAISSVFS